jgi:phospholipase C
VTARDTPLRYRLERRQAARTLRRHPTREQPLEAEQPVGHDTFPQIRHIVVLMMENHSYDNYLGMLAGRGDGFTLDADGKPIATNTAADGTTVRADHWTSTSQVEGLPLQTWGGSHIQWDDGACGGFVKSVEDWDPVADRTVPMRYWNEEDLPFYYGLARTFPLADRWFCSCLGPTFPNRRFMIAGTAHGLIDDLPFGLLDYPEAGTIFDVLTANGISWVNYHNVSNLRLVVTRLLGRPGLRMFRAVGLLLCDLIPRLARAIIGNLQFTADLYPLGALSSLNHLRSIDRFFSDAADGTLPAVSIVDPDFTGYSEESPQDVQVGEGFAAAVVDALMRGKGWPGTMLIWTYDEHGGYYDHVSPPPATAPDDVEGHSLLRFRFALAWIFRRFGLWQKLEKADKGPTHYERLGFRVPAVVVSPYSRPNFVSSTVFDHTSVLKLIERKWNLAPLTRRDAAAADPLEMIDLESPPAFLLPPPLPTPAKGWTLEVAHAVR